MSVQTVSKSDLANVLNRWISDTQLTDADTLEITANQESLVIRKPQEQPAPSKSAVLETHGTIHLPARMVHEIALSQEMCVGGQSYAEKL